MKNLNTLNKVFLEESALIQNELEATRNCSTLDEEIRHMVAGGKNKIYLQQLVGAMTGKLIAMTTKNITEEDEIITVFPINEEAKTAPQAQQQSLNASLYMVACH